MRRLLLAAFFCLVLSTVLQAQGTPKADVAVGYSLLFLPKGFTLTMNGGSVAASFSLNDWVGVAGEFGVDDGSPGIPGLVGETYTVGPRFSYRITSMGGDLALDRAGKFGLRAQLGFLSFRTNHNLSPDSNTGAFSFSTGIVFRIRRK